MASASDGTQGNAGSYDPVFSPDGSKIAFVSTATNLVPSDTNGYAEVFVKDLVSRFDAYVQNAIVDPSGENTGSLDSPYPCAPSTADGPRVSSAADGAQGKGRSSSPAFSPDGSKVAVTSEAPNLVPTDTNGMSDVFMKSLTNSA